MTKPRSRRPTATPTPAGSGTPESKGFELSAAIGRELKALFDNVAAEPVPDKFRELLDQLERKSGEDES